MELKKKTVLLLCVPLFTNNKNNNKNEQQVSYIHSYVFNFISRIHTNRDLIQTHKYTNDFHSNILICFVKWLLTLNKNFLLKNKSTGEKQN